MNLNKVAIRVASPERVSLTPEKEGAYGAPDGQMIALLQEYLCDKYAIDIAYRSFADRVRGPWRDALVDHWHDHAEEERKSQYDLAMKIVGMGADPMVVNISVPQCPANVESFCLTLMQMELDVIDKGRKLIELSGDNTSMKVFAENLILTDTQHADDLRRMCEMYVG